MSNISSFNLTCCFNMSFDSFNLCENSLMHFTWCKIRSIPIHKKDQQLWNTTSQIKTVKSTRFYICFRRISWLTSAIIFLRWFILAYIYIQVCRDGFRDRRAKGHLSFWGPTQVWPIWPFGWKAWKYVSLTCSAPSKNISFVVPTSVPQLP